MLEKKLVEFYIFVDRDYVKTKYWQEESGKVLLFNSNTMEYGRIW